MPATLRVLVPSYPASNEGKAALDKVVTSFNAKYPNVKVEPDFATFDTLNQKISTSIAGGQAYDVLVAYAAAPGTFVKVGAGEKKAAGGMTVVKVPLQAVALYTAHVASGGRDWAGAVLPPWPAAFARALLADHRLARMAPAQARHLARQPVGLGVVGDVHVEQEG